MGAARRGAGRPQTASRAHAGPTRKSKRGKGLCGFREHPRAHGFWANGPRPAMALIERSTSRYFRIQRLFGDVDRSATRTLDIRGGRARGRQDPRALDLFPPPPPFAPDLRIRALDLLLPSPAVFCARFASSSAS
jgi:hypothetical protein